MKRIIYVLVILVSSGAYGQNSYPSSGNVKIFAVDESWAEGISIVNATGWSGLRINRNNPASGNYNGSWALGYNAFTGNDFSISTNYNGTQYDGLFHISNSTRNVGIGTTTPNSTLSIKGRVGIRADASPTAPVEALRVEGAMTLEENVMNITNLADQDFVVRLSGAGAATKRTIIGPTVSNRFSLGVGTGNEHLTVINGGNVGIGTISPAVKLHVSIAGSANTSYSAYSVADIGLTLQNKNATNSNLNILSYADASGWGVADVGVITNHTAHTAKLFLSTRPAGSGPTQRLLIDENGNVGIGTTNPNQKLTVNGTIYGKEVKVDLSVPGPDYVFADNYQLPTLTELKTYIDQHKHLPEVPSAAAMEANGINLSEMNMILLKKVEELTLYLLELKKENDSLKSRVTILEN